jgi:hypothetical protein
MQGMRDLLRGNLARSLRPLPEIDRLAAAWPVACGSSLAGRGEVAGYAVGVVRIVVASEEWMQPLGQMRGILVSELARIAGVPVTAIHFETRSRAQQSANRKQAPQR